MEDDPSGSLDGKTLGNLRVVDLKQELDKRGLSKSGTKKDLVKRLKQQLEFEKFCEERKTTGDSDSKLELDAVTEQNEFVQQYLAQQQKIYAEQKEVRRLIELEEIQKSSDERESCDSSQNDNDILEAVREPEDIVSDEVNNCDSSQNDGDSEVVREVLKTVPDDNNCDSSQNDDDNNSVVVREVVKTESDGNNCDSSQNDDDNTEMVGEAVETESNEVSNCEVQREDINSNFEKNEQNIDSCSLEPGEAKICEHETVDISSAFESNQQTVKQNLPELGKVNYCGSQTKDPSVILGQADQNVESNYPNPDEGNCSETQTKDTSISLKQNEHEQNSKTNPPKSDDANSNEDQAEDSSAGSDRNQRNINLELPKADELNNSEGQAKDSSTNSDQSERSVYSDSSKCGKICGSEGQIKDVSSNLKQTESIIKHSAASNSSESDYANTSEDCTKDTNITHEQNQQNLEKNLISLDNKCSFEISSNTEEGNPSTLPLLCDQSEISISCGQEQILDMEPATQFSSVPYSLSDIQLPESPGNLPVSVSKSPTSSANISNSHSFEKCDSEENLTKHNIQSNGVPVSEVSASSDSKNLMSEVNSEADTEINMSINEPVTDIKESNDKLAACEDKKLCEESIKSDSGEVAPRSSDTGLSESNPDRNDRGESSLNNPHTESSQDDPKAENEKNTSVGQSEESENEKSSDSDEYQHRKTNSYKIPVEKNADRKPLERKMVEEKSSELNVVPPKQKLKIKRDNVIPEIISKLNVESSNQNHAVKSEQSTTNDSSSISSPTVEPNKSEPGEVLERVPQVSYVPRKVSLSNRKLNRKSGEETKSDEPKAKKSKWSSFATVQKTSQTISISTDSLKNWFPDFKLINEPAPMHELGPDEPSSSVREEKNSLAFPTDSSEMEDNAVKLGVSLKKDVDESELWSSAVENNAEQGPASKIIFIQNLVRPFTLQQLKILLKQSGNIIEENFWIDKIKSKCFVMYETEEAAIKARSVLNEARWPSSNPKILSVEFSTEEELEFHKRGNEPPKPVPEQPIENREPYEVRTVLPVDEHRKKERDRRKEKEKPKTQPPVREWDKDKISQDSPEKENIIKEAEKGKSSEKKEKKDSKRRTNEDTPAKLLDDLFQKTKASPCIYWLPLTEEQVKQREEAQRIRRLEREKRNQQLKEQAETERRNKRARSGHRGRETENRRSSTRSRSPVSRRR